MHLSPDSSKTIALEKFGSNTEMRGQEIEIKSKDIYVSYVDGFGQKVG